MWGFGNIPNSAYNQPEPTPDGYYDDDGQYHSATDAIPSNDLVTYTIPEEKTGDFLQGINENSITLDVPAMAAYLMVTQDLSDSEAFDQALKNATDYAIENPGTHIHVR